MESQNMNKSVFISANARFSTQMFHPILTKIAPNLTGRKYPPTRTPNGMQIL